MKVITDNRKAFFDYFIDETYEAGIVLEGSEVKSIKMGNINLKDSFCFFEEGELILKNCHITPYEKGSFFNKDAKRDRKLLMHRSEIDKIFGKVKQKGFTLVPLKVYFSGNYVKIELGLARGKHTYDKKETLKQKDIERKVKREIAEYK